MALTKAQVREILSAAGVDSDHMSEAVNRIIEGHTASIEALREERDTLKEKAQKAESLETENAQLKKDAETFAGKDYDKLKADFEAYKKEVEGKETRARKEKAYREILKDAGIAENHHDRIVKYSKDDIDGLELDDKGKAVNAKDILKAVKAEWSDHTAKETTKGAETPTPPKSGGSGSTMTKDEIMQIKDTSARQAALKDYLVAQSQSQI